MEKESPIIMYILDYMSTMKPGLHSLKDTFFFFFSETRV
jgi:hypothetical protein